MTTRILINGELMGQNFKPESAGIEREDIVRIPKDHDDGPTENAIIRVQVRSTGEKIAHYTSWIGYFDLDLALAREPDVWKLIEPSSPYREEVDWSPYK